MKNGLNFFENFEMAKNNDTNTKSKNNLSKIKSNIQIISLLNTLNQGKLNY